MEFKLCKNMGIDEIKNNKERYTNYFCQIKYDGCRGMLIKKNDSVKLINREGNDIGKYFPNIIKESKKLSIGCYDGELIGSGTYGDFHKVQTRFTDNPLRIKLLSNSVPVTFMIFDFICDLPLNERLRKLRINILDFKYICVCPYFDFNNFETLWSMVKSKNIEGLVIKKIDSLYNGLRNMDWIKIKFKKSMDIEFNSYEKTNSGCVLIKDKNRVTLNGKNSLTAMRQIISKGICNVEVEYLNKEVSGLLRQPVVKRLL